MSTLDLLKLIEMLRPRAGSLIQTILGRGGVAGSSGGFIVDSSGRPTQSVRIIARALEVMDDFSKTTDFGSVAPSRAIHAYYVVEHAVLEQYRYAGELLEDRSGGAERRELTRDIPSGTDSGPADSPGGDLGGVD